MTAVYWIGAILGVVVLVAVAAQEHRYLRTRREIVSDRQSLFHSSSVFHTATVMQLAPGQDLHSAVRGFVDAAERSGAKVVYAGKVAVNALRSSQIPDRDWDAFVLVQFPSREAASAAEASPGYQKARASFAGTYTLGMQRSAPLNLAIPVVLLAKRVADIVTRQPRRYPFRPAGAMAEIPAEARERQQRLVGGLLAEHEYGKDAVVVLNFIKNGSPEQRKANSAYGSEMLSLMAETGNGPMHIARAVTLEGEAEFDQVVIVYYPGVEYFAEMVQSEFFTGIVGGKQLGDSQASPTVPLLPHL